MYMSMHPRTQGELWALCAELEVELKALDVWDREDAGALKFTLGRMREVVEEPPDRTYVTGWHG